MSSVPVRVAACGIGACLLSASLHAQAVLLDLAGTTTSSAFGQSIAVIGDVNGDGRLDLAVGAPFALAPAAAPTSDSATGSVRILSGLDGALLGFASGTQSSELFGWSVAAAGDVNGDDVPDVLVGAPNFDAFRGRVVVLSGAGGGALLTLTGNSAGDRFGWSVASLGDVDGDDRADFAVGAWNDSDGLTGQGTVSVLSGASGSPIVEWSGAHAQDHLGSSLAAAGDVDLDGVPDLLMGGELIDGDKVDTGGVVLRSVQTGGVLFSWTGGAEADLFGRGLAGPGDATGDGVPDVLVGAPGKDFFGSDGGEVSLYDGASGLLALTLFAVAGDGQMGMAVAGAGDVDGDGRVDLAVGAPLSGLPFLAGPGRAAIRSSATGAELVALEGATSLGGCGTAVACADIDGDGAPDFAVSEPFGGGTPYGPGLVRVLSGDIWVNVGLGLAGTEGVPQFVAQGQPVVGQLVTLQLHGALPGAQTVLLVGASQLMAPFKGGTLVPHPDWLSPVLPVGVEGALTIGGVWPPGAPAGMAFWFQWWVADSGAAQGWASTEGLRVAAG